MNFFSGDGFLLSVAEAGFRGRAHALEVATVDELRFRLLTVEGRPIVRWPFLDFFEPLSGSGAAAARLPYLQAVSRRVVPVGGWKPEMTTEDVQPAPFIDWSALPSWSHALELWKTRPGNRLDDSQRRRRKLAREVGPIQFVPQDPSLAAFQHCLRWKSAQYLASGYRDLFADRRNVDLFSALRRRGLLAVSSLYAGERLAAVHLGAVWEGRFYYWVPAYDGDLQRYAPGRLLLEEMLAFSHRSGHAQFDFLVGGEPYKFAYATHVRVVEPAGEPPFALTAARAARRRIKSVLTRMPGLWKRTEPLRRALRRC
jgi:GNAT acetyltransferase-like protein